MMDTSAPPATLKRKRPARLGAPVVDEDPGGYNPYSPTYIAVSPTYPPPPLNTDHTDSTVPDATPTTVTAPVPEAAASQTAVVPDKPKMVSTVEASPLGPLSNNEYLMNLFFQSTSINRFDPDQLEELANSFRVMVRDISLRKAKKEGRARASSVGAPMPKESRVFPEPQSDEEEEEDGETSPGPSGAFTHAPSLPAKDAEDPSDD